MGGTGRVGPRVRSNLQMPPPAAATITVRATLALLDGPKREIAEGVANDEYVFWLGSGISRDRLPDLRAVAKRVLVTLQARLDQSDPALRFQQALAGIVHPATPHPEQKPEQRPDG